MYLKIKPVVLFFVLFSQSLVGMVPVKTKIVLAKPDETSFSETNFVERLWSWFYDAECLYDLGGTIAFEQCNKQSWAPEEETGFSGVFEKLSSKERSTVLGGGYVFIAINLASEDWDDSNLIRSLCEFRDFKPAKGEMQFARRLVIRLSKADDNSLQKLVKNLTECNVLDKVVVLDIAGSSISDISPILLCTNLGALDLSRCQEMDLNKLAILEQLRVVVLTGCTWLTDIKKISEVNGLRVLCLKNCTGLKKIGEVGKLKMLRHLDLTYTSIVDIDPLKKSLESLEWLDLTGTKIFSLEPLRGKKLGMLVICNCVNLTTEALDPVKTLHLLKYLDMANTPNINKVESVQYWMPLKKYKLKDVFVA